MESNFSSSEPTLTISRVTPAEINNTSNEFSEESTSSAKIISQPLEIIDTHLLPEQLESQIPETDASLNSLSQEPLHSSERNLDKKATQSKLGYVKFWSTADDEKLKSLVERCKKDWKKIAKKFQRENKKVTPHFLKNRFKFLNNDKFLLRIKFEHQEDLKLAKLYKQFGSKWEAIAHQFPNRTPVMLKNRYYSYIRKHIKNLLEEIGETWVEPTPEVKPQKLQVENPSYENKKTNEKPMDTQKLLQITSVIDNTLGQKPIKIIETENKKNFDLLNLMAPKVSNFQTPNNNILANSNNLLLQSLNPLFGLKPLNNNYQMPNLGFSPSLNLPPQGDLLTLLRLRMLKNQLATQNLFNLNLGM